LSFLLLLRKAYIYTQKKLLINDTDKKLKMGIQVFDDMNKLYSFVIFVHAVLFVMFCLILNFDER